LWTNGRNFAKGEKTVAKTKTKNKNAIPSWVEKFVKDSYPTIAQVGKLGDWRPIRADVVGFRDLRKDPLTLKEFAAAPMLERGRFELRVVDRDSGKERRIYRNLLFSKFQRNPLRIGFFDGRVLVDEMAQQWGSNESDRRKMRKLAEAMMGQDLGDLRVGVFADDAELVLSAA
jgi:hypothetical protein